MKITILTITSLLISAKVLACPESHLAQMAMESALFLETINGNGKFLTRELYPLGNDFETYGIIFSYSGVQNFWKVKVDSELCTVKAVIKN